MGKLKQSGEIIELGKVIVNELGLQQSVDTTSRWMGHYLAELLSKLKLAKTGASKKKLEKECVEIILKLWERKNCLPINIDPLDKVKSALEVLEVFKEPKKTFGGLRYRGHLESKSSYANFAKEIDRLSYQILQLTLTYSLANGQFSESKKWREKFGTVLSDDEKNLLDKLDLYFQVMDKEVYIGKEDLGISELSPAKRKKSIIDKLEQLIDNQKKALNNLKKEI